MKRNIPDMFNRWDGGTKLSLNAELGSFEIGAYYDFGLVNQSLGEIKAYNRSFGFDFYLYLGR